MSTARATLAGSAPVRFPDCLPVQQVADTISRLPDSILVLTGPVTGNGWQVDVDRPDDFRHLAQHSRVVYLHLQPWRALSDLVDRIPSGLDDHPAIATAQIVLDGVVHTLTGADPQFITKAEATSRRLDREEARWQAEQIAHEDRLAVTVTTIENTYPDRLLACEDWLTSTDQRARTRIARTWAADEYPDLATHQRIRTALLNAEAFAVAVRDRDVIPARLEKFEASLAHHGEELARTPGWQTATTKATRHALARHYLAETDPLVTPAIMVDRLVDAATATPPHF